MGFQDTVRQSIAEAFYEPGLAVATSLPLMCHWSDDRHVTTPNHGEARKCSPALFGWKGYRFEEHMAVSFTIPNLVAIYWISLVFFLYMN